MEACAQSRHTAYESESPETSVAGFQFNSLWIGNIRASLRYRQVSRQSCIYVGYLAGDECTLAEHSSPSAAAACSLLGIRSVSRQREQACSLSSLHER
jgi:hypothetical protein